jgi:hypothetical protein
VSSVSDDDWSWLCVGWVVVGVEEPRNDENLAFPLGFLGELEDCIALRRVPL